MKQLLLTILAVIVVANIAFAGDDAMPKSKSGDKAVLFTLNGLSNLGAGNFQGGIGGKYYISDGNALRLGLGFGTNSTTTKYNGAPGTGSDIKGSNTAFSFSPAFLHNLNTSGPVVAYIGAQVSFVSTSSTTENPGFVTNNKVHDSGTIFGIAGIFGVEWFAWNNISLAAEYQLAYASGSGTHENTVGGTTTTTDAPSTSGFGIGSTSGANFTVAIFW